LSVFATEDYPETYIPGKRPKNYNALERVAVRSDEIAGRVRDNCARTGKGSSFYIPGRSRFKMMYKGEEIVKPSRKTMKKLAQVAHHEKCCYETRRGKLMRASDETHRGESKDNATAEERWMAEHPTTGLGRRITD
jgi:hypothetical protein